MFHARSIGNRLIAKIELKGGPRGGFNDLNRIKVETRCLSQTCYKTILYFHLNIYLYRARFFRNEILYLS